MALAAALCGFAAGEESPKPNPIPADERIIEAALQSMALVRIADSRKPVSSAWCIDSRGFLVMPLEAVPEAAPSSEGGAGGPGALRFLLSSPSFPSDIQARLSLALPGGGIALLKAEKPLPAILAIRETGDPEPGEYRIPAFAQGWIDGSGEGAAAIELFPCRIAVLAEGEGHAARRFLVAEKHPVLGGEPVIGPGMKACGMRSSGGRGMRRSFAPCSRILPLIRSPLVNVTIAGMPPDRAGGKPVIAASALLNPIFDAPEKAWLRFKWPENRDEKIDLSMKDGSFHAVFLLEDLVLLTYHREEVKLELFCTGRGAGDPNSCGVFPIEWQGPVAGAKPGEPEGPNLAPNGGFEEGAGMAPLGWGLKLYAGFDGLTTFREKEEGRGMVVRVDTDVLLDQAYARWKEMELPADKRPAPPGKVQPTEKQQYQTVGGNDGVHVVSEYITVSRDTEYFMSVDVFSKSTGVKIFVDGYAGHDGRDRIVYRNQKSCGEAPDEKEFLGKWHTYSWRFHPTRTDKGMPLLTEKIRIKLYAYWPRGEVWFDNVVLRAAGKRSKPSSEALEKPDKPFRKNPKITEEGLEGDE